MNQSTQSKQSVQSKQSRQTKQPKQSKQFKGRVLAGGTFIGEAIVSHSGVNSLATFQGSVLKGSKNIIASDQNNPDIFQRNLTGKALCLPVTIGSTTGGLVIQTVCAMKANPAAFLFSEHIDPLAASGIVLARVWEKQRCDSHRPAWKGFPGRSQDGRHAGNQGRRHHNNPLT